MSPAAPFFKTYSLHDARKPKITCKGVDHPNYIYGPQTTEAKKYRVSAARLSELEQLIFETGMFDEYFYRTVGRKLRIAFDTK